MNRAGISSSALMTFSLAVLSSGCSMEAPQEGQFRCTATSDCPDNWACNADGDGYCYSSEDLFPPIDTNSTTGGDADSDTDSDSNTDTGTGEDTDTGSGEDTDTGTGEDTDTGTPLVLHVEAECAFGAVGDCDGTIQGGNSQTPSGDPYLPDYLPELSVDQLFVGYLSDGTWLRYDNLNLEGYTDITMTVAGPATWGPYPFFEIRLDAVDGPLIGTITPGNTGGWDFWVERTDTFVPALSGIHDVYIVSTSDSTGNIGWFEFTR